MTEWVQLKLQIAGWGALATAMPAAVMLAYGRVRHRHACSTRRGDPPSTLRLFAPVPVFAVLYALSYGAAAAFLVPAGSGALVWMALALGLAIVFARVGAAVWCRTVNHDPAIHSPTRLTLALYSSAAIGTWVAAEAMAYYA